MSTEEWVDLRSDTVTRPTEKMRRAMAEALVGDDVYGEDPTVNRLQEEGARRMGMEDAIFMPSGTMGNQVAIRLHAPPGSEVVLDGRCHIMNYEMAAMSALSGLMPRPLATESGLPSPCQLKGAVAPGIYYMAPTALLAVENTHNMAGGRVLPLEGVRSLLEEARAHALPAHLDGARIFNAAVALGVEAREVARGFDSVMFCLSKGLGAPAGSLLCGSADFVRRARAARKLLGGGMRQVGILAAAGLVALEEMTARLEEDHRLAAALAEGLGQVRGLEIVSPPESNMVMVRVLPAWFEEEAPEDTAHPFLERLSRSRVLASAVNRTTVRLVTHYQLPGDARERTLRAAAPGG